MTKALSLIKPFREGAPKISASSLNTMLDTLKRLDAQSQVPVVGLEPQAATFFVQNVSGVDVTEYQVLGIGDNIFDTAESGGELQNFLATVVVQGQLPTTASYKEKFVITLEPIANGAIGRCMYSGTTKCKLNVTDADHDFADVTNNSVATLTSGSTGSARILWKEAATGTDIWGLVRFPAYPTDGGGGGIAVAGGSAFVETDTSYEPDGSWIDIYSFSDASYPATGLVLALSAGYVTQSSGTSLQLRLVDDNDAAYDFQLLKPNDSVFCVQGIFDASASIKFQAYADVGVTVDFYTRTDSQLILG